MGFRQIGGRKNPAQNHVTLRSLGPIRNQNIIVNYTHLPFSPPDVTHGLTTKCFNDWIQLQLAATS